MGKAGLKKKSFIASTATAGIALLTAPSISQAYADPSTITKQEFVSADVPLVYGEEGQAVKTLQIHLNKLGFYELEIDGIYGPHTERAVKRFQLRHGLIVDGIAGVQTISALHSLLHVPKIREGWQYVQYGDKGQEVSRIQKRLQALGYYEAPVDGIFGILTERAVKNFQRDHGLLVDGIVGPNTRGALHTSYAAKHSRTSRVASTKNGLVADALRFLGTPYEWGGESPGGFDCSGFIQYVFKMNGIHLPRTVSAIWNYGISVEQLRVGDLVFFETYKKGPSHVGIYIGGGKFIHTSSDGVEISNMNMLYWRKNYLGAKKIVQYHS